MKKTLIAAAFATTAMVLTGCTSTSPQIAPQKSISYSDAASNQLTTTNYAAADSLIRQLKHQSAETLIVATVVNIDSLGSSSTLGRLISEQVAARFTQNDFKTVELKFRESVYMAQGQGELMLTRNVKDLAKTHAAQAVVVGTYATSADFIYINLKVIQPSSNTVIAVHDYALPMDTNNRSLLRSTAP